jgi:hypothetical protein
VLHGEFLAAQEIGHDLFAEPKGFVALVNYLPIRNAGVVHADETDDVGGIVEFA